MILVSQMPEIPFATLTVTSGYKRKN